MGCVQSRSIQCTLQKCWRPAGCIFGQRKKHLSLQELLGVSAWQHFVSHECHEQWRTMIPSPLFSRCKVSISSLNLESLAKTHEMWGSVLLKRQPYHPFIAQGPKGGLARSMTRSCAVVLLAASRPVTGPPRRLGVASCSLGKNGDLALGKVGKDKRYCQFFLNTRNPTKKTKKQLQVHAKVMSFTCATQASHCLPRPRCLSRSPLTWPLGPLTTFKAQTWAMVLWLSSWKKCTTRWWWKGAKDLGSTKKLQWAI